jgi:DUF971 family protein
MEDVPEAPPPTTVELDRERGELRLEWPDGGRTRFDLDDLRRACPCAECRGRRERGLPVGPPPGQTVAAVGAELVGAWGMQIEWSDGHATGIYAWGILRAWQEQDD